MSIHSAREMATRKMQQTTPQSQNRNYNQLQNKVRQNVTPHISYAGMAQRNHQPHQDQIEKYSPQITTEANAEIDTVQANDTKNRDRENQEVPRGLDEYTIAKIVAFMTKDIIKKQ